MHSRARYRAGTTIEVVASVFALHPLTLVGLAHSVRYLVLGAPQPKIGDPSRWMKAMAR